MSGIALEHVSKVFPDGTAAVVDMDLRIQDGEFCVLVGPSGCGKSTVLRLVAGLEEITRGTIRIGDRVVNGLPPVARDIAMVFESAALYPHLNVAENMGLALRLRGAPAVQRVDRVRWSAGRLGLGDLLGRRPRDLSEGERHRVGLGRALVRRPRAFLMDEPLSALDAELRVRTRASIARLHRELGSTMFYVTHDQGEAMALADRVAVMRAGRLEQVDEPRALYDRPATLFAAAFIGSPPMNLWHVRLAEENGHVVLVCGDQRLPVPRALLAQRLGMRSRVGGHLVLGLRPEMLTTSGSGGAGSALELPVVRVETLGSHLLVHVEAEGAGMQLADAADVQAGVGADDDAPPVYRRPAATLVARLPPHTVIERGDRVRLFVDLERAHFFDLDTQDALR
jgi:multiple sugar transport system ATP-binding protein